MNAWDPDLDLDTGVLRNRLGITDPAQLARAETDLTLVRMTHLATAPIAGHFDLEHLQAVHRYLFTPIYDWAGQLRTVSLGKGGHLFCPPEQLRDRAGRVFLALAARDHLADLDRAAFLDATTELLAALLYLHPFREGNGRAIRVFLAQLARTAGYRLRWAGMDAEDNRLASRAAYDGDLTPLHTMLDRLLST